MSNQIKQNLQDLKRESRQKQDQRRQHLSHQKTKREWRIIHLLGNEANRTTTSNKKIRRQCNKEHPPESLFVSFNIIREQMQRVNQMADHLDNQFHGHRDGLMEVITDTIMNENTNDATGVDSDSSDTKNP